MVPDFDADFFCSQFGSCGNCTSQVRTSLAVRALRSAAYNAQYGTIVNVFTNATLNYQCGCVESLCIRPIHHCWSCPPSALGTAVPASSQRAESDLALAGVPAIAPRSRSVSTQRIVRFVMVRNAAPSSRRGSLIGPHSV